MLSPDEKIAAGYGSVTLVLENGKIVAGVVRAETTEELQLLTPQNEIVKVPLQQIEERSVPKSLMPSMANILSPRELRDLVEFLATLP